MKLVAKFLLGYLVAHILLISIIEAYYCVPLKMFQLVLLFLIFGIAVFNAKNIIVEKSDLLIIFSLLFLNIFYTFIDGRGLWFFNMTYTLALAILVSKVIPPNISLKRYLRNIEKIYLVLIIGLVIEYLLLVFFGESIQIKLFMCTGHETGTRGYIQLYNMTKEILPYHITGLNSIMMGGQTASQLSVIMFVWFFYRYRVTELRLYMIFILLAVLMIFLSPTVTSLVLLFIAIILIYFFHLSGLRHKKIRSFYRSYVFVFLFMLSIYLIIEVLTNKHSSLDVIYEIYVLENIMGFSNFTIKEVLFGMGHERQVELFKVTEIAYLEQLARYGFFGVGVFYISIFYFIIRALAKQNTVVVIQNIAIILIFVLGNAHYPVMLNLGVVEIFALHLAYLIYIGSTKIKKNSPETNSLKDE